MTLRSITLLLLIALQALAASCKKEGKPSPQIVAAYQAQADRFCNAIVDCMREEILSKLADSPERRDMVAARMNRDLCLKGQYSLIGRLSIEAYPNPPKSDPEPYRTYGECVDAVASATRCDERRELYRNHPACRQIHRID